MKMLLYWAGAVAFVWILDYLGFWSSPFLWLMVVASAGPALVVSMAMRR